MLNKPHSPTNTLSNQTAAFIAALLTFSITSFLVAVLYFTTPLFGLLAASTLTLALGSSGIGLLVFGLAIAAYFITQAILAAKAGKPNKPMMAGADDAPPFTPSSNSPLKKSSGLNKGVSKTNAFADKAQFTTGVDGKTKSASRLFQPKAPTKLVTSIRLFNREKSEVYQTAWNEKKEDYDAAIKKARKTEAEVNKFAKVDDLQYLVITGFANEEPLKNTEHLQAETFVREYIKLLGKGIPKITCKLIFNKGTMGLSALQLAAAELDIEMVSALLLPFTNNPDEVRQAQRNIASNTDLSPEQQWQEHTKLILNALPEDIREVALAQLQAVKDNNWMINRDAIENAYENLFAAYVTLVQTQNDKGYSSDEAFQAWHHVDSAWGFVGECQPKLSRALLLDCYFNPHSYSEPIDHFYNVQLPRIFKFENGKFLFPDLIEKLGVGVGVKNGFGIYRERGVHYPPTLGSNGVDAAIRESALYDPTLRCEFGVRTQQLDWIIDRLTLSMDSTKTASQTYSPRFGGSSN